MKSTRGFVFTLGLLLALPAAASVSVDFDEDNDFSGYKTYSWVDGTPAKNDLSHKRIVEAIEAQLAAKGLTQTEGKADVYVAYHGAVDAQQRLNVSNYGYGTWGGYRGYRGWGVSGSTSVTSYDVHIGTLIIDIIDTGTDQLVWRGHAEKELAYKPNPEKSRKKLNKILGKMFRKYPPN